MSCKKNLKHSIKIFVIFTAIFLAIVPEVVCQNDIAPLKKTLGAAEKYKKKITIPAINNSMKKKAGDVIDITKSPDFQSMLKKYTAVITNQIKESQAYQNADTVQSNNKLLESSEKIYIFISSSIPAATLKNYTNDLDTLNNTNISMVMRGFVGGMKHIKPTMDFIKKITHENPACDPLSTECAIFNADIIIDPMLFRKYNITAVPAIIYKNKSQSYTLYGDISLQYALEQIFKKTNNKRINNIIKKLRGDFY